MYFIWPNTLLLCIFFLGGGGCNSFRYFWYWQCKRIIYMWFPIPISANIHSPFCGRLFLKNIKNFLCKYNILNNHIIPSTHVERKITVCSHKHSFTLYPCLSPYRQTDKQTEREMNTLAIRGMEELFFQLCCCVSFLFWREIGFGFTYSLCT